MRVVVCFPPDFSVPTAPFGALPLFGACLRASGHEAEILDLAALTFRSLIDRRSVERWLSMLDEQLERARHDSAFRDGSWLRALDRMQAIPRELLLGAEDAASRMRNPDTFFQPEIFARALDSLTAAMQLASSLRPRLDPRNRDFADRLYSHLEAPGFDPLIEIYDTAVLPRLRTFQPQLLALTIPFALQLPAAMRFCRWARERFPDLRIVAGGTAISDAADVLLADPRFFGYVELASVGDGEEALPELATALEHGGDLAEIPGLFRIERGEIRQPALARLADMDRSPTPDFSGIDLGLYVLPEKIASLTSSRGCYYGKCTFCPESFRQFFCKRSSNRVWQDVLQIATEQGIRHFMFWDPLTPPGTLDLIARGAKDEGLEIHWMAEVKFDQLYTDDRYLRTLASGGCRMLQFGFESGVQRVLDGMDKGNDLERIDVILSKLHDAGIAAGVFWFIGFPTELESDARETWRFLAEREDKVHFHGYVGTFGIGHDVPVYKDPGRYDIEILSSPGGDLAFRRRDGRDWDRSPLHETYFSRSDLVAITSGATLLYLERAPDRAKAITGRRLLGPPSFMPPAIERRSLRVPETNGFHQGPGETRYAYVGRSGRLFMIEPEDRAIIDAVRQGSSALGGDPNGTLERLRRLIDRGILASD